MFKNADDFDDRDEPSARPVASRPSSQPRTPGALDLLLVASATGDQRSFHKLYVATSPKLLGQAMAMLRHRDAAEDALQDAYIRIWANCGRYDAERGPATPWMARVLRNVIIDRLRRERLIARYHVSDEGLAEQAAPRVPLEDRLDLVNGLATLSPEQRNAILHVTVLGWTHEEAGNYDDVPVPTSKARAQRGLRRLRALYDEK
jgi:RNA polymerase sigma-70 factor, ECF subfamily